MCELNARNDAEALLRAYCGARWSHVKSVAALAGSLSRKLDLVSAQLLNDAAWLHDIGYSPIVKASGFHPLDGARFLRMRGYDSRVCGLVAFHSAARFEAGYLGLSGALGEFVDEGGILRDLLWYSDMTNGPTGQRMAFDQRMAEVRVRYGPDHYVTRALGLGMPEREAAVRRAEEWIESVGLTDQV